MNHWFPQSTRHRKLAAFVLLAGMIYQLGACPCGCLEHNAWLHLLGIESDHHAESIAAPLTTAVLVITADTDHHDCTGESRPAYFDNARPIKLTTGFHEHAEPFLSIVVDAPDERSLNLSRFQQRKRSLALAHALSRPNLQVYRL